MINLCNHFTNNQLAKEVDVTVLSCKPYTAFSINCHAFHCFHLLIEFDAPELRVYPK